MRACNTVWLRVRDGRGDVAHAIMCVLTLRIEQAMAEPGLSKTKMAKRMKTSRAQLDRLLDPDNDKVQLVTVQRAATALGCALRLALA